MGKIKIEINYFVVSTILKGLQGEVTKFKAWLDELQKLLDDSALKSGLLDQSTVKQGGSNE